jgi:hypothetical protein
MASWVLPDMILQPRTAAESTWMFTLWEAKPVLRSPVRGGSPRWTVILTAASGMLGA